MRKILFITPKKITTPLHADEARHLIRDAYIYGFPIVDNYRILHSYFVDIQGKEYKGPWNIIHHTSGVYTPDDRAVQTPNSDTPYSILGADLRAEPLVITLPAVEDHRYYSAQFVDAYTFNFAYAGTRTFGNKGGRFLLAGPHWVGDRPDGMQELFRCETELALVIFRTQLFGETDLDTVIEIQKGYKAEPLSQFLGQRPPLPSPRIEFIPPLNAAKDRKSLQFFPILNFMLQYCTTHPSERTIMERFARAGIGGGQYFNLNLLSDEMHNATMEGISNAWALYEERRHDISVGRVTVERFFGSREEMKNDFLTRMVAAAGGIYGNSLEEAWYKIYYIDSAGHTLDTSDNDYVFRFPAGKMPPVHAFWSVTLYELPSQLLSANALNRYLINSSMLPHLKRDSDEGLTIYIQNKSPGAELESNWLPAPRGPIKIALRLYLPKDEVLLGKWKAPPLINRKNER